MTMTTREIVQTYFALTEEYFEEILPRLKELCDEGKITWGGYCYVYSICDEYHSERLSEMIRKANAKLERNPNMSYGQALNDTAKKWDWEYHLENFQKFMVKCIEVIENGGDQE